MVEVKLPSDRKFGFFFAVVFVIIAVYLYSENKLIFAYASGSIASIFFFLALFKDYSLRRLNKLWMQFGLLLGIFVSPIILGIIFFGLITPTAILMRLRGRDALRLRSKTQNSFWIKRQTETQLGSFKTQF